MKQRLVVQAVVHNKGDVLLLRRSQGRPGLIGRYELPGGSIENGEQPDDAIHRHLLHSIGVGDAVVQLYDAVSMVDRQEGDIQHVFILYTVDLKTEGKVIKLGRSYDMYNWVSMKNIHQLDLRNSASYLLELYGQVNNNATDERSFTSSDDKKTTEDNLPSSTTLIYSDGGSRGNPGPSAAAFVLLDAAHTIVEQGGEYLGITTNNQAEYHGVRLGLEKAASMGLEDIEFRIDSMLVVNQLKGIYKVKNRELWPINERIIALLSHFKRVTFTHIPRENNKLADALVNKLLDEHRDN